MTKAHLVLSCKQRKSQGAQMVELLRVVSALRERIDKHRMALRANEMLTRYALVDPLLVVLGWDMADPTVTVPEFSVHKINAQHRGRTDYALFASRDGETAPKPNVIVEAKKLDDDLRDAASQALSYCMHDGIEYFVVTDGNKWLLYKTLQPGDINAKRLVSFDVQGDQIADVCRSALALWREGFAEGTVRATPAYTAESDTPRGPVPHDLSFPQTRPSAIAPHAAPASAPPEGEWVSLATLAPETGAKPLDLRLPTGAVVATHSWRSLIIEVVRHVADNLSSANLPLSNGSKHLVASQPIHPNGEPFQAQKEVRGLFVNLHYSGGDIAKHCRTIAEKGGVDPKLFGVKMAP